MRATARKATLAVAATALAIGTLAGCGGDDGDSGSSAPDNASTEDFCAEFASLFQDVLSKAFGGESGDSGEVVQAMKDWAAGMAEVGTPEDMPDEARKGFEVFVDEAQKLPDDATMEDLESLGDDLPQSDQDAGDAFGDWAAEACPDALLPGVPSDLPTDVPSDLESMLEDMPTDLPTDLPTDPSELESFLSELTQDAQ